MSTKYTKSQTCTLAKLTSFWLFAVKEQELMELEFSNRKILSTKDSLYSRALYGDKLIGEDEPILINKISERFIHICVNNIKADPAVEDSKLLLYRKIIKSISRKKLREYLLKSKAESVLVLAKIAVKKDLKKLIKIFIKSFPFGLPTVSLTKSLIENTSLFDNLPRQNPPPSFSRIPMDFEERVESRIGVDSPTIRLWLNDFSIIAGNLISSCKSDSKKYEDFKNYNQLIDLYKLMNTEASYCKFNPTWKVSQLLVTLFAYPEIFGELHKNCMIVENKAKLCLYLQELSIHMPHADYVTMENLHAHYMYFTKKLAKEKLLAKESKRLGVLNASLLNVDVDIVYQNIFGCDRESVLACLPPMLNLNKCIIDVVDGYECSDFVLYPYRDHKNAIILIDYIKSLPVERRPEYLQYGIAYTYNLMRELKGSEQKSQVPERLEPFAREIKTALTLALL